MKFPTFESPKFYKKYSFNIIYIWAQGDNDFKALTKYPSKKTISVTFLEKFCFKTCKVEWKPSRQIE